jgi:hypothetical protein
VFICAVAAVAVLAHRFPFVSCVLHRQLRVGVGAAHTRVTVGEVLFLSAVGALVALEGIYWYSYHVCESKRAGHGEM